MIRHIVLFKLKEMDSDKKLDIMNRFKSALEALVGRIDVIRSMQVGLNINPNEAFDIALTCEFDNMADLATYATHPEHVAAGKIIAEAKESRSCVDYEF